MGIALLDDVYLMAIAAGGISCGCLYGVGSKVAHLKAERSWAVSLRGLAPIRRSADIKQRMMQRVEGAISSISTAFDEYMRQLFEEHHLAYTSLPLVLDLTRDAVLVVPLASSSRLCLLQSWRSPPLRCRFDLSLLPLALLMAPAQELLSHTPLMMKPCLLILLDPRMFDGYKDVLYVMFYYEDFFIYYVLLRGCFIYYVLYTSFSLSMF